MQIETFCFENWMMPRMRAIFKLEGNCLNNTSVFILELNRYIGFGRDLSLKIIFS